MLNVKSVCKITEDGGQDEQTGRDLQKRGEEKNLGERWIFRTRVTDAIRRCWKSITRNRKQIPQRKNVPYI